VAISRRWGKRCIKREGKKGKGSYEMGAEEGGLAPKGWPGYDPEMRLPLATVGW